MRTMKTSPERLARINEWAKANPERVKAAKKKWRDANKDKIRQYAADARVRNPDYNREWQKANREKAREYSRRSKEANPEAYRRWILTTQAKNYGLTLEELQELIATQGHECAICGQPPAAGKRLCVDHDHVTGRVRGMLCSRCNRDLDRLIPHIHNLISYLARNGHDTSP